MDEAPSKTNWYAPKACRLSADMVSDIIGITSTMLSAMKGVKMAGLTEKLTTIIQRLRLDEIASAAQFRMMMIYTALTGESYILI